MSESSSSRQTVDGELVSVISTGSEDDLVADGTHETRDLERCVLHRCVRFPAKDMIRGVRIGEEFREIWLDFAQNFVSNGCGCLKVKIQGLHIIHLKLISYSISG